MKEKIQISKETHELLVEAGKGHWTRPRPDLVYAKGKGTLQTHWLTVYHKKANSVSESSATLVEVDSEHDSQGDKLPHSSTDKAAERRRLALNIEKTDRLIDWIVDLMKDQLTRLRAQRGLEETTYEPLYERSEGAICLDEVADIIPLSRHGECKKRRDSIHGPPLNADVQAQLRQYVAIIASTYRSNAFHSFEHACHVTMALSKYIKRITATAEEAKNEKKSAAAGMMYDYTRGIHSDPLTVLAILFSALIHDADHRGISNAQLRVEEPEMASFYDNTSIAEQNSLDIAWDLLMTNQFSALQRSLFTSAIELQRFRQVLVNAVLATDLFDKDINNRRQHRWSQAFSEESASKGDEVSDLRATLIIEYLIQASDVSHTMQHWNVYRKWNQRLFHEMYVAYTAGRSDKDPSSFWYHGELGFFDNYVIPLAKKLKECGAFGVSSDECLLYAMRNRSEWEIHGPELIAEMVQELHLMKHHEDLDASFRE